jgi:hypothetical protein
MLKKYVLNHQTVILLHLGDHDPSGIDMSRDIEERLRLFMDTTEYGLQFERIALNIDQIERYNPPPNPAKVTDSRYAAYQAEHGEESWELDALEPKVITRLIEKAVAKYRDPARYKARQEKEKTGKKLLTSAAKRWDEISTLLQA